MLWDLIRDFFVQHVFGGYASNGDLYQAHTGSLVTFDKGVLDEELNGSGEMIYYQIAHRSDGYSYVTTLSDWLSTTATIISISIIVVLCCLFIYKIVRLIGGLIR